MCPTISAHPVGNLLYLIHFSTGLAPQKNGNRRPRHRILPEHPDSSSAQLLSEHVILGAWSRQFSCDIDQGMRILVDVVVKAYG